MSNRPRVLVGILMHPGAMMRLKEVADVDVVPWDMPNLHQLIGDYDGLIVYTPRFEPEMIRSARRVKVIACHSCASDVARIAAGCGIRVTLVPSLWDTVADMTIALMFATARKIPQAHAAIKNGDGAAPDLKVRYSGYDVFGKTLGIIGLGRIGTLMAKRVQGFDMTILYHDIVRKTDLEDQYNLGFRTLENLIKEADIISLLIPVTEQTQGLIGEKQLRLMKRNAILINTGRGALIDEVALYRALNEHWIAAAGLDVLIDEPVRPGHPLSRLDNVVITPHLGGSTMECDLVLVEDTIRVLGGQEPLHPYG